MATNLPEFIMYHPIYHLLLCKECKVVVPKDLFVSHLQADHLFTTHQIQEGSYKAALEALELQRISQAHQQILYDLPIPPIQGLELLQAHECSECGKVFLSAQSGQRHASKIHEMKTLTSQNACLTPILAQSLSKNKFYFKVTEPATEPGPSPTPGPSQPHQAQRPRSGNISSPLCIP